MMKCIANWITAMIYNVVNKNTMWRRQFIINYLYVLSSHRKSKALKWPFTLPSPSSWIDFGCDTVKHCITSYRWQASWFSVPGSSGGWISILQLKVWLFRRVASWGQGTPFTGNGKFIYVLVNKAKKKSTNSQDTKTYFKPSG
jgi:hypothetical protein